MQQQLAEILFLELKDSNDENKIKLYTIIGIVISGFISIIIAYLIPSVVEIWYTIGSLFIPGIIFPVISAYYQRLKISKNIILIEMIGAVLVSVCYFAIRGNFSQGILSELEPMLVGLSFAVFIHCYGLLFKLFSVNQR